MFELTQFKKSEMDSLINGYANSLLTDDELNFMLDIILGEVSNIGVEF